MIVNDESQALGPPGSHVRRLVGSEAGARVWKVEGLEDLLRMKQFTILSVFNSKSISIVLHILADFGLSSSVPLNSNVEAISF